MKKSWEGSRSGSSRCPTSNWSATTTPTCLNPMLDPDQISQVFLNLINNAGDAIDGSGTITLSTRHDDGSVRVTVTDTGVGMTPEVMQRSSCPSTPPRKSERARVSGSVSARASWSPWEGESRSRACRAPEVRSPSCCPSTNRSQLRMGQSEAERSGRRRG